MKLDPIVTRWYADGAPVDSTGIPHEVKAHIIVKYAEKQKLSTLVETGTGFGAMIALVLNDFDTIHTIEMQPNFYQSSKERFKDEPKVHLYLGDSGALMQEILGCLDGPALFFLDAHYAGDGTARGDIDTPIVQELVAIMSEILRHTIVVDDARLFGKEKDYPTLDEVADIAEAHGYSFQIEGDEIVLT